MSHEQLSGNAFILMLAGSETSAAALAGATYYLLTNGQAMDKLKAEVRSAFESAEEISVSSVARLSYLSAVISETLRMYPPQPADLVRIVPPEGANIAGHLVPGGVSETKPTQELLILTVFTDWMRCDSSGSRWVGLRRSAALGYQPQQRQLG
jgi:hypothetical protein